MLLMRRDTREMFTIGQVARQGGVSVEAVRFYERRGLIDRPRKPLSGFRRYPTDTVDRLRFIRRAAALGFTLREVSDLLALRSRPDAPCADVRERATAKVADIDRRIAELQRLRTAVVLLVDTCQGDRATAACSILGALAGDAPITGETLWPPQRRTRTRTPALPASKRASGASRIA